MNAFRSSSCCGAATLKADQKRRVGGKSFEPSDLACCSYPFWTRHHVQREQDKSRRRLNDKKKKSEKMMDRSKNVCLGFLV